MKEYNPNKEYNPMNDDNFDFEGARIECQILDLWDAIPDCLKTKRLINEVFKLAQSSPDLITKMNLNK